MDRRDGKSRKVSLTNEIITSRRSIRRRRRRFIISTKLDRQRRSSAIKLVLLFLNKDRHNHTKKKKMGRRWGSGDWLSFNQLCFQFFTLHVYISGWLPFFPSKFYKYTIVCVCVGFVNVEGNLFVFICKSKFIDGSTQFPGILRNDDTPIFWKRCESFIPFLLVFSFFPRWLAVVA